MSDEEKDYILDADYEEERDKLSKSVKDMGATIEKHENIDSKVAKSIGIKGVRTSFTKVRKESIKFYIKNILDNTSDEEIKGKRIQVIFRSTLIEIKNILLDFIDGKESISNKEQIQFLTRSINSKIKDIIPDNLFMFTDKDVIDLLDNIKIPEKAFKNQNIYFNGNRKIKINKMFSMDKEEALAILGSDEVIDVKTTVSIKIKKPVYESDDKWTFHFVGNNNNFTGVIKDKYWLNEFQNRILRDDEVPLPKDTLVVLAEYKVIKTKGKKDKIKDFKVLEVQGIIKYESNKQQDWEK